MRVLIGFSRCPITVTLLRLSGIEAWTCDLRSADHPYHIQGNIWDVVNEPWDWGIFHPMCTYLTCSAAWAFNDPDFTRYPGNKFHQQGNSSPGSGDSALSIWGRCQQKHWPMAGPTTALGHRPGCALPWAHRHVQRQARRAMGEPDR